MNKSNEYLTKKYKTKYLQLKLSRGLYNTESNGQTYKLSVKTAMV